MFRVGCPGEQRRAHSVVAEAQEAFLKKARYRSIKASMAQAFAVLSAEFVASEMSTCALRERPNTSFASVRFNGSVNHGSEEVFWRYVLMRFWSGCQLFCHVESGMPYVPAQFEVNVKASCRCGRCTEEGAMEDAISLKP